MYENEIIMSRYSANEISKSFVTEVSIKRIRNTIIQTFYNKYSNTCVGNCIH